MPHEAALTFYAHDSLWHYIRTSCCIAYPLPSLPINTSCETVYDPIPWDKEICEDWENLSKLKLNSKEVKKVKSKENKEK